MIIDGTEFTYLALPKMYELNSVNIKQFCEYGLWSTIEACFAAYDRWPSAEGNSKNIDPNTPTDTALNIIKLHIKLKRAIISGDVTSQPGTSKNCRSVLIDYINPHELAKWLHRTHHSADIQLYRHFKISAPSPFIDNCSSESDVPSEIKSQIFAKYVTAGGKRRWGEVDIMMYCSEIYMRRIIEEAKCKCRHDKLALFVYDNFIWENIPLKQYDAKNRNLLSSLKKIALLIVPPERRFGWSDNNNISHYRKAACLCEIPSHQ